MAISCQDEEFIPVNDGSLATRADSSRLVDYYWYMGEKYPIYRDSETSFVFFKNTDKEKLISELRDSDISFLESDISECSYTGMELSEEATSYLEDCSWLKVHASHDKLYAFPEVRYAAPYYTSSEDSKFSFPLTNVLYVSLKEGYEPAKVRVIAKEHGMVYVGAYKEIPGLYILVCDRNSSGNALEMADKLHDNDALEYASASFMDFRICTNDVYYPQQWNLQNTGQYGSTNSGYDVRYSQAQNLFPVSSQIVVGVVDTGVELNHPDLNLTSYSWDTGAYSTSHVYDNHGTQVAGIISAYSNNSIGIAGASSLTRVMSLSFNNYESNIALRNAQLAAGIRHAVDQGADVINCSWSIGTHDATIASAINYASENGRNGKGCVIVCSSGNEDYSYISFPSSYFPTESVIAVGAITYNGKRKSFMYPDGGNWGSNYGSGLDVVAPGVKIPTTTIGGTYTSDFSGTSAAAPHVSALAAQILSVNSSLTPEEVEFIICRSANKGLPGYTFTNNGYKGTWNNEVGYGLIDMNAALSLARATNAYGSASVSGYGSTNSSGTFYGSTNLIPDSSGYAWANLSVNPNNLSYTYLWDGVFTGECDRWFISPTNSGHGPSADVSIYLDDGDTGGRLEVRCFIFSGATYIGKTSAFLYVSGNNS